MNHHGGPRILPALWVLLCLALLAAGGGGQGPKKCREQAVAANGVLTLLLEKPLQGWTKVDWKVKLGAGSSIRILTVEKNKTVQPSKSPFYGRAIFQPQTLSLWISPVSTADSGVYRAEFEDASGVVTTVRFCVSVWEPVVQPRLETRILHREQSRCNLSLLCTVPAAANISYSWWCTGDPPGVWGEQHQPRLQLEVRGDANPNVCCCNASNPVSWSTASTNVTAACHAAGAGLSSIIPRWAVAVSLGLALAISITLIVTCYWWRKRGKDPSGGHVEQTPTVYEEVGRARTGQDPNGTSEATAGGNTIYAVICTKTQQGPSRPPDPGSCTIYSTIQPTRKSSSLKKKLDPALVSTAYVEAMEGSRHCPLQTSPPDPTSHRLS